jgi:3-phytase
MKSRTLNRGKKEMLPDRKKLIIIIVTCIAVAGAGGLMLIFLLRSFSPAAVALKSFHGVEATFETTPVPRSVEDDAADDPAIWINIIHPDSSRIIGTDKKGGLAVYDLTGRQRFYYPDGYMNNADIRYGFGLQNDTADVLAVSNRSKNSVSLYRINHDGSIDTLHNRMMKTELEDEVYGLCMYKSNLSGKFYVFVNNKFGVVEQWELVPDGNQVDGHIVRKLKVPTQVEGMAADDENGFLYVGEEDSCIWKFNAEPDDPAEGARIEGSIIKDNKNIRDDIEGIAICNMPDGNGYIIASSQGNNSYAVFSRTGDNRYLGSFCITDGIVDGTEITDGLDVTGQPLGNNFPHGLLVVQDGTNKDNGKQAAQNFKLVRWDSVVVKFTPDLQFK